MSTSMAEPVVADHVDASRFEVHVDGELAGIAEYRRGPGVIAFTHTLVDPQFEGLVPARRRAAFDLPEEP